MVLLYGADARALIEAANLGVTIAWPNEPFTEPSNDDLWLIVEIVGGAGGPIELGQKAWWEFTGAINIYVNAPIGSGSAAALTLSKQVLNVFRGLPERAVVYLSGEIGAGEPGTDDGRWWRLPVSIEFRYQDPVT